MPTRLKAGDYQAEFMEQRVATALVEAVEAAPPESKGEVAGVVQRVAQVAPEVAALANAALVYDSMVVGLVEDVMSDPEFLELPDDSTMSPFAIYPHFSQVRVPRKELEAIHERELGAPQGKRDTARRHQCSPVTRSH